MDAPDKICGKPVDYSDDGYLYDIPPPYCGRPAGHEADGPCGTAYANVGDICRFCGKPQMVLPCPDCWTPLPDSMADIKAVFAESGIDLSPPVRHSDT